MPQLQPIEDLAEGKIVPGLFDSRADAEAAIEDLREHGFEDEELGWDPIHDTWCGVEVGGDDILVLVHAGDATLIHRAKSVMESHDARCFPAGLPPKLTQ